MSQYQATQSAILYQSLTVGDALSVLSIKYGRHRAAIVRNGLLLTVGEALTNWPGVLLDKNCQDSGLIEFHGGPPGRAKWFSGSIYTFLCDAALFEKHTKGQKPTERLSL